MIHRSFRLNLKWLLLVTALAVGAALLAACGGDDDDQAPTDVATTDPAGDGPADTGGASPTAATTLPEITSLCDLVTPDDVKDVLGASVTGSNEFKDVSCGYSTALGALNIERGSQRDFDEGVALTGDLGEAVPGIDDEAAWFGGSATGSNTMAVRKGDFYFQIRLFDTEVDGKSQLEVATELAIRAVERLP
ncbi:MAG: hypothetical protein J4O12_07010 [Chloroflexi bacterium]|nr:hypothetical protein [Chloroflexota bacterium]